MCMCIRIPSKGLVMVGGSMKVVDDWMAESMVGLTTVWRVESLVGLVDRLISGVGCFLSIAR